VLLQNRLQAHSLADIQPDDGIHLSAASRLHMFPDPGSLQSARISPGNLCVLKSKFPVLQEFSDEFLQFRNVDELLRIESTSLRIRDAERVRDTEERLAANKAALPSKLISVPAGQDNRWDMLHVGRFLPGAACSAQKQWRAARDYIGLSPPPAVACYDMTSVGLGGFVSQRGWLEIGNLASTKMKVGLFSINNCTGKAKASESTEDCSSVAEFTLALRTMRVAMHFANPFNVSIVALENFLLQKKFFTESDLQNDDRAGKTLSQFCDFVLSENSNHWRDGSNFLTTGELQGYWDSFIGARPHLKSSAAGSSRPASRGQPQSSQNHTPSSQPNQPPRAPKRKFPFLDICNHFNFGRCQKAPGACVNSRGVNMRHVCNWRDPQVQNAQPCAGPHMRMGNHP